MKKLILALVAMVISCSVIADVATRGITFDPNTEVEMDHYNLYVWVGTDTTQCNFFQEMPIDPTHPNYDRQISYTPSLNDITYTVNSDGKNYFAVVLQAVNTFGDMSRGGFAVNSTDTGHFELTRGISTPKTVKIY